VTVIISRGLPGIPSRLGRPPASLFKIRSPSVGLASDVPIRQPSTFSSSIFSTLCRYVTAVEGSPLATACSASARYLTS
jgi:hypothetical protein